MRALSPLAAGSLLFALAGCSSANPSGATANAAGATSGRDDVAAQGSTDSGSRLFGAEPLGALVVETLPTLAPGPRTEPEGVLEPRVPAKRAGQPVYRSPTMAPVRPAATPPPPPPPHVPFPPASGTHDLTPAGTLPPADARNPR